MKRHQDRAPRRLAATRRERRSQQHAHEELTRQSVAPGYWPRSMLQRLLISVCFVALVPARVLPMEPLWLAVSGGTLITYSLGMYLIYLRYGLLSMYERLWPFGDTLLVTLAIVALAQPDLPIWLGYFLIITVLANFQSTRYILGFSLWTVACFLGASALLDVSDRADVVWRVEIIVSIMAVFMGMNTGIIAASNWMLRDMVLRASVTDPLTGLANRRLIQTTLDSHAEGPTRPLAIFMLDIDDFKQLNEERGHVHADGILVQIAGEVRAAFPDADAVGRVGGDELLVLTHVDSVYEAVGRGEQCVTRVHNEVGVWISVGVSVYPLTAPTIDSAIRQADTALGLAKRGGKARVVPIPRPAAA
ncbi:MAG: GGDEF domain-containing protein [Dehalococcoidia bacterium]